MFGYVRPNKGELLVREFARFRAVYCGICKEISRSYGQIPRVALTYDITMLGVLMISLSEEETKESMERCMLNPVQKRPMLQSSRILHRCAALSVLLSYEKFMDEIADRNPVVGNLGKLLLKKAAGNAAQEFPTDAAAIFQGLEKLRKIEKSEKQSSVHHAADGQDTPQTPGRPDISDNPAEMDQDGMEPDYLLAASMFGEVLQIVFQESFQSSFPSEKHRDSLIQGIGRLGYHMGRWIFILDAVDDYEEDIKKKNWNPFMSMSKDIARETALKILIASEEEMDRIAALLPYKQDAGIISNIIQQGLSATRQKIFLDQKLGKL